MDGLGSKRDRHRFALWNYMEAFLLLHRIDSSSDFRRKIYTILSRCSKTEIADTAVILAPDWPGCHAPGSWNRSDFVVIRLAEPSDPDLVPAANRWLSLHQQRHRTRMHSVQPFYFYIAEQHSFGIETCNANFGLTQLHRSCLERCTVPRADRDSPSHGRRRRWACE